MAICASLDEEVAEKRLTHRLDEQFILPSPDN
jgi:hypothetical protein